MDNIILDDVIYQSEEAKPGTTVPITSPIDGIDVQSKTIAFEQTINQRFHDEGKPLPYPAAGLP